MYARIRALREDHDMTQTQIARILNMSQTGYSKYETGEYELPMRHFITLAKYYNVSADYLIGRCDIDDKSHFELIYVTPDCSLEKMMKDVLALCEHGREAVVEYIELQKLKETK